MKCLILAAGKGSRLSHKGAPKPLVPLLGLPLLERVILNARSSGVTEFYVVVGYAGEAVQRFLEGLGRRRNVKITPIPNESWERENGLSVLKAKGQLGEERFLLLMGDHLVDEGILRRLQEEPLEEGELVLAVDSRVGANPYVDLEDVTRVLVTQGRVADIGKRLSRYNAFDTGVFLCSSALFSAIETSMAEQGDSSLTGGVRLLAKQGRVRALDIQDRFWIDIDDEAAFRKAERHLLEGLVKSTDGPVSRYLNRPLSLWITKRFLLNRRITPNQISFFSFLLSMAASALFCWGHGAALAAGGVLAQLSSVVDGCDGEVARLKHEESDFGGWFDAVLDRYADGFLLLGLTYFAYAAHTAFWVPGIGFLAILGTFMNSYTADKYDGFMRRTLGSRRSYFRLGRDVRMFLIFLGALAQQPLLVLGCIALLMNVETIRRIVVLHRRG